MPSYYDYGYTSLPSYTSDFGAPSLGLGTSGYAPTYSGGSNPYAGWDGGGGWGAVAGAAIGAVGSYLTQRGQQQAQQKMTKQQFRAQKYFDALKYKQALEDQQFTEQAIGNYRDQASPGLMDLAPAYTDPNTVQVVNPYAKR